MYIHILSIISPYRFSADLEQFADELLKKAGV